MINEHLVPEVEEGRVAMDLMSLAGQLIGRAVQLWDLNAAHTRALGQLHRHVDDYAHMKWALKCNVTCNVKDIFANKTTKQFDGPSHCTCTLFQTSSDKKQYPSSQFHIVFRVCMEIEKAQGRGDSVNLKTFFFRNALHLIYLLPCWFHGLAVTTPGCVHHDKMVTATHVTAEWPVGQNVQLSFLKRIFISGCKRYRFICCPSVSVYRHVRRQLFIKDFPVILCS